MMRTYSMMYLTEWYVVMGLVYALAQLPLLHARGVTYTMAETIVPTEDYCKSDQLGHIAYASTDAVCATRCPFL